MTYRLASDAEAELDDIWHYVAKESGSVEVADHVIHSLEEKFYLLSCSPYIGRSRIYDLGPDVRSFPAFEYVIFYHVQDEVVLILHVIRGSRDLRPLLRQ